jgi:hypothetical protein
MASTYVNDLRLNELATGDGSGTWGTTTNTNLELIAEGLSFGTEAIATNADTHTSTVADGSTDPVRSMYVKYTGTLDSACTITIAPNTISRLHFIENGTSGSQNIIISQGSGASITIPPGDVKVVYLDGAGSGAAVVDAFASLSVVDLKVQDDLTVTDAITASGVITGLTLEATGDTAAGDNAAIGFTSAEGLILTGQGSTSDITFKNDADTTVFSVPTGTDDILFPDNAKIILGTSSDLQISHDSSNSIIHDNGTGGLRLQTNSLRVLKADASENIIQGTADGSVILYHDNGVKLTTATTGIDITGAFTATDGCTITTADNTAQLTLTSTDADATAGPVLLLNRDSGSPADGDNIGRVQFKADDDAGGSHTFARIDGKILDASNGNETGGLEIMTEKGGSTHSRIEILAAETVFNEDSVGTIDFRVESDSLTHALFVDASENFVGIGESAPNVLLHVTGAAAQIAIDTTSGGEPLLRFRESGSSRGLLKMDGSNNYQFHTGPDGSVAEVGRFDASGNFMVAGTSISPGLGNTTTGLALRADGIVSFSGASNYFNINRNGTGTIQQFSSSGNAKGSVTISSSGVTYDTTSDIRLKQDIEPLQATDKLMAMNPVSYTWKADPDGPRSMGFIAQEMEKVMPEAVSTGNDGMMQMDYGRITPILVSALQDAHKKIEELESRIAAMESK